MRKLNVYIIAGLVFSLFSCEDVLDKNDLTAISQSETWNDVVLATGYLDKCYYDNMPVWDAEPSRNCDEAPEGTAFLYGQRTENSETFWPYDEIYRVNILINNIDKGTLKPADKNKIKAQALFLRSFQYFELVKRYGGVPLILKPQDRENDDLYVQRSKTSECIAQIVADLDTAAKYLPSAWTGVDVGRISKGAAMAYKGRVLMFYASRQFNRTNDLARWQAAYDAIVAAKAELEKSGYGLNASFREIWAKVTKESIIMTRFKYPGRYHNFEAGLRPLDYSQNNSGLHNPTLDLVMAFPMKDGTNPGVVVNGVKKPFNVTATDTTGLYWLNRDPRFYETIVYNGCVYGLNGIQWPEGRMFTYNGGEITTIVTKTGFYSRKFVQAEKTSFDAQYGTLPWIEMRYAEVLLNLAECAAELGGREQEVYDQLKAIRKRAGISANGDGLYGLKAGMTGQELTDAVIFEKQIELAFEAKRFWDMRRRMMFTQAPFVGYVRTRIIISPTPAYATKKRNDFIAMVAKESVINTKEYFKYFSTIVKPLDEKYTWAVPELYYFYNPERKHFEQNPKLEATLGYPNGTFDPLQ